MRRQLKHIYDHHLDDFEEFMVLKNFSRRTVTAYMQAVYQFLDWWDDNCPDIPMSDDVVRKYLVFRFESNKAWQTVNSDYSAIQKWFKNVLMLRWDIQKLPRPRKERQLPRVFSREDIVKIIEGASTFKHQVLLTFIYVTGVRLSEAIHMRIDDVDGNRKQIRIAKGKGGKDRYVLIPDVLLELLRTYYLRERPEEYLFNGKNKGKPLSQRAVQWALQEAKKNAGVKRPGGIHTLRNCYATHHLEGGTDLVFLQEQMGHKQLKTTIRYIGLCVERHRYVQHPINGMAIRYQIPTA
ncbi:MAG: tyrosine-type recombinase/integrase [Saprospiraceae bacterium]